MTLVVEILDTGANRHVPRGRIQQLCELIAAADIRYDKAPPLPGRRRDRGGRACGGGNEGQFRLACQETLASSMSSQLHYTLPCTCEQTDMR